MTDPAICPHGVDIILAECVLCDAPQRLRLPPQVCRHGIKLNTPCAACVVSTVDMVNHPPHYTTGGIETIDFIEAKLSAEEFTGYCRGNAMKYLSRAGLKGPSDEDIRKAKWYLDRLTSDR